MINFETDNCSICLDLLGTVAHLENDTEHRRERVHKLNCGHTYCKLCIAEWVSRDGNCPTCRAAVTPKERIPLDAIVNNRDERVLMMELLATRMVQIAIEVVFFSLIIFTGVFAFASCLFERGLQKLSGRLPLIYPVVTPVMLVARLSYLFFAAVLGGEVVLLCGFSELLGSKKLVLYSTDVLPIYGFTNELWARSERERTTNRNRTEASAAPQPVVPAPIVETRVDVDSAVNPPIGP